MRRGPRHYGKKKNNNVEYESNTFVDDDDCEEYLDVEDAADIWMSSGQDEDYMFGYTREELEAALYD